MIVKMHDWLAWQLIDSTFPSGGFAHSGGLEAAWQNRLVAGAEDLTNYLETALKQLKRGILIFGHRAWRQPDRFDEADADCDLFLNNHVANRASRAQGKALLSSAAATFEIESIKLLCYQARERRLATHLTPVFGFITRSLGFDEDRFASMFLFISIRGSLSAAVRLGIVGPLEAQRIQAGFAFISPSSGTPGEGRGEGSSSNSKNRSPSQQNPHPNPLPEYREGEQSAVQTAPLLDLLQAGQDRLYSRLFQS